MLIIIVLNNNQGYSSTHAKEADKIYSTALLILGWSKEEGCRVFIRGGVVTSQEEAGYQGNQSQAKKKNYCKKVLSCLTSNALY